MGKTKRKDSLTGRTVNDGKQAPTLPGEVTADNGVYKMNRRGMDFGSAECPEVKRMCKRQVRRAIRRDGNELIKDLTRITTDKGKPFNTDLDKGERND